MNIFFHCKESRNETLSLELNFFFILAPMIRYVLRDMCLYMQVMCPILATLFRKVLQPMVLVLNLETILAIVSAIPFQSSLRALLSCGLVCCILSSGFTFNDVRIVCRTFIVFILITDVITYYCKLFRPHSVRNKKEDQLNYNFI